MPGGSGWQVVSSRSIQRYSQEMGIWGYRLHDSRQPHPIFGVVALTQYERSCTSKLSRTHSYYVSDDVGIGVTNQGGNPGISNASLQRSRHRYSSAMVSYSQLQWHLNHVGTCSGGRGWRARRHVRKRLYWWRYYCTLETGRLYRSERSNVLRPLRPRFQSLCKI